MADRLLPTPGPWRWRPPMTVMGPVVPVASDVTRRNGPLIAAAPQMLEALQAIHAIAAAGSAEGGTFGDLVSIESIARHAIGVTETGWDTAISSLEA